MGKGSTASLTTLLCDQEIGLLVDVRRFPASRRHRQFGRDRLEADLASYGLRSQWWGQSLGGRRSPVPGGSRHPAWNDDAFRGYADHMDQPEFRASFTQLLAVAHRVRTAIMCSESSVEDWRRGSGPRLGRRAKKRRCASF